MVVNHLDHEHMKLGIDYLIVCYGHDHCITCIIGEVGVNTSSECFSVLANPGSLIITVFCFPVWPCLRGSVRDTDAGLISMPSSSIFWSQCFLRRRRRNASKPRDRTSTVARWSHLERKVEHSQLGMPALSAMITDLLHKPEVTVLPLCDALDYAIEHTKQNTLFSRTRETPRGVWIRRNRGSEGPFKPYTYQQENKGEGNMERRHELNKYQGRWTTFIFQHPGRACPALCAHN